MKRIIIECEPEVAKAILKVVVTVDCSFAAEDIEPEDAQFRHIKPKRIRSREKMLAQVIPK